MNMKNWDRLIKVLLLVCLFLFPTNSLHAQNMELMEDFENPTLPGWERSDNTLVSDGTLKVSTGGFAFHGGFWHDLNLTIRMNHPGTAQGNWQWRLLPDHLSADLAARLRRLVELSSRLPEVTGE